MKISPPEGYVLVSKQTIKAGDMIWRPGGWVEASPADIGNNTVIYVAVARRMT